MIFRFSSSLNWGSEVSHHGHHGIWEQPFRQTHPESENWNTEIPEKTPEIQNVLTNLQTLATCIILHPDVQLKVHLPLGWMTSATKRFCISVKAAVALPCWAMKVSRYRMINVYIYIYICIHNYIYIYSSKMFKVPSPNKKCYWNPSFIELSTQSGDLPRVECWIHPGKSLSNHRFVGMVARQLSSDYPLR